MLTVLPKKDLVVKRFMPSENVKGTITKGAEIECITVVGSWSNASPNDIARLPEGKRTRQAYKLFTLTALQTASPGLAPDWIQYGSEWYEVSTDANWDNVVMTHHEYICTKIENPKVYADVN